MLPMWSSISNMYLGSSSVLTAVLLVRHWIEFLLLCHVYKRDVERFPRDEDRKWPPRNDRHWGRTRPCLYPTPVRLEWRNISPMPDDWQRRPESKRTSRSSPRPFWSTCRTTRASRSKSSLTCSESISSRDRDCFRYGSTSGIAWTSRPLSPWERQLIPVSPWKSSWVISQPRASRVQSSFPGSWVVQSLEPISRCVRLLPARGVCSRPICSFVTSFLFSTG